MTRPSNKTITGIVIVLIIVIVSYWLYTHGYFEDVLAEKIETPSLPDDNYDDIIDKINAKQNRNLAKNPIDD